MEERTFIWRKMTLVGGLIGLSLSLGAQSFRLQEVRDLQQMKHNYGNAVADYDLDGNLDVFIVAFDSFDPSSPQTWSRLLKNYGNGRFEDVTLEAGFANQHRRSEGLDNKMGASWGDFNNDGYPDLCLTHIGRIELYQNLGNGKFREVSATSNLTPICGECVNNSSLWWDYNKDGHLDLYISDGRKANRLYRNEGNGTFEDVTDSTDLGDKGATWSSVPIDVNHDGWLDLLVLNDYGQSTFYESIRGQYFEEKTQAYGLVNPGDAMGATIGDCDSDGYFDMYITNISEFVPNPLFMGTHTGAYVNRAEANRVEVGHWAWGTRFFDADHDGDEDLYLVNGWPGFDSDNKFYKNLYAEGHSGFVDWSRQSSTDGPAHGMSTEVFDYDNDGDLDILVSNTNDAPNLYENIGTSGRNWLQVELEGTESNRNGFGAVLSVWVGDRLFKRFHHGSGIMSQSVKPLHVGLGSTGIVDSLAVHWPSGLQEIYYAILPNQKITLTEGLGEPREEGILTLLEDEILTEERLIRIYPNPFDQGISLRVETQEQGKLTWSLYTLGGAYIQRKELLVSSGKQLRINLAQEHLSRGVYMLRLELNGRRYTQRLIKY
ncbi:MAG: FG-GAP-like repeat-containing protein [Bacteroidota bacterium]